jgi:glycine cleavage system aminomethyltransferase T
MVAEGTALSVRAEGGVMVAARVVALPFYDAAGARQKSTD